MNKTIIILISILIILSAIILGAIIYMPNKEMTTIIEEIAEEEILDECTDEYEEIQNKVIETNAKEEKISPNAVIIFKRNYDKCGHTTSQYMEVSEDLVNKTKREFQEKYAEWNIQKFSDTEIVLEKRENGNCGEHYIVKEKEGRVTIYEVLEDGSKKEYEETDIGTEYLTETDKNSIIQGIEVYGKQNLNQLIENFE